MALKPKSKLRQTALLIGLGLVCVVSFQNCGADFVVRDDLSLASLGMTCESQLQSQFESSYAPFLKNNCAACHVSGPGKGSFASNDSSAAFGAFLLATSDRINTLAVSPSHASPYTGAKNQDAISGAANSWNQAVSNCKAGTGETEIFSIATAAKPISAIATNRDITWNLDSEMQSGGVPTGGASLIIAVRAVTANGYTTYFFNTPRLKTGSRAVRIAKLMLSINGQRQVLGTTYSMIDQTVPAGQTVPLSTSQLILEYAASPNDTLAIVMDSLEPQ